jgi:hypothetical protein
MKFSKNPGVLLAQEYKYAIGVKAIMATASKTSENTIRDFTELSPSSHNFYWFA